MAAESGSRRFMLIPWQSSELRPRTARLLLAAGNSYRGIFKNSGPAR